MIFCCSLGGRGWVLEVVLVLRLSVLVVLAPLGEDGVGASVVLVVGGSVSYGVQEDVCRLVVGVWIVSVSSVCPVFEEAVAAAACCA